MNSNRAINWAVKSKALRAMNEYIKPEATGSVTRNDKYKTGRTRKKIQKHEEKYKYLNKIHSILRYLL